MEVYYDYPTGNGEDVFKVYLTPKDIQWLKIGKNFLDLYQDNPDERQLTEPTINFLSRFIDATQDQNDLLCSLLSK